MKITNASHSLCIVLNNHNNLTTLDKPEKKIKGKCSWQPQPLGLVRTLAFTAVYRKADEKFIYS